VRKTQQKKLPKTKKMSNLKKIKKSIDIRKMIWYTGIASCEKEAE